MVNNYYIGNVLSMIFQKTLQRLWVKQTFKFFRGGGCECVWKLRTNLIGQAVERTGQTIHGGAEGQIGIRQGAPYQVACVCADIAAFMVTKELQDRGNTKNMSTRTLKKEEYTRANSVSLISNSCYCKVSQCERHWKQKDMSLTFQL